MSIDDWADLMAATVTLAPLTSRDRYGAGSYGAAVSYQARVSYRTKWIRMADGSIVNSQGEVWLRSAARVDPEARLTLPDGTTPPILMVQTPSDESGAHNTKLIFG